MTNKNSTNAELAAYIEKKFNLGWSAQLIVDTYNQKRGYTAVSLSYVNTTLESIRKRHARRYAALDTNRAPKS